MSIWAIIHFLFSIGFIVVPLILCYKKFSKAVKGSYINAFNVFVIIYTCPSYTGGAAVSISSFAELQLLLGIIGGIIGLGVFILDYGLLKCKNWAKESHDDFAFNHASGIIGGYAFFYFIIFGALSLVVPDGEKILDHKFYYESNAFSILAIESFYMIGVLFSVTNTFFLIKYEPSNSHILGILNIAQQTYLYTINILFILDFNSFYIANLVIFSKNLF